MIRRFTYVFRFQQTASEALEKSKLDVVELRIPLTSSMRNIQVSILELIEACLQELRKTNPDLDLSEVAIENALFKSFDSLLSRQLDPIWHRIGFKTKQLASDLKTLRKLLG